MQRIDQTLVKEVFSREGFVFPLDAMTADEAAGYRNL